MISETAEQSIEIEISMDMIEALSPRADSMGLTASEYIACVLGQHVISDFSSDA